MRINQTHVYFDFKVTPLSVGPFYKAPDKKIYTEPKFRANQFKYKNLMHNQQVYRGKTVVNQAEQKQKEGRNDFKIKRPPKRVVEIINPIEIFGQPPKKGMQHSSTMTDCFKQVLEKNIFQFNQSVQTKPLLNRPANQFQEFKNGVDQAIQVEEEDCLIDFNF